MAGSQALRGFPILLEWESRMEEGWRPEIPHPQGFPPCRDLLWQRAAGSPASVGFSPIRATAGSAGRRKPHTRGGCPFPRVRMEGASPSSAGGFPTPEIYRSLTQRKPRNPQFFSESPFKVGEGLQEAPHLQGFTVPAGEAFFSFPVDGLHRFSPASADETQPSVGSPTRKDSPLIEQEKNVSKSEAPHPQRFTPIVVVRRRFIVEARTRRDSSSVSRGNLLKRQEAPHPQGLLPPLFPRRRAAGSSTPAGVPLG